MLAVLSAEGDRNMLVSNEEDEYVKLFFFKKILFFNYQRMQAHTAELAITNYYLSLDTHARTHNVVNPYTET